MSDTIAEFIGEAAPRSHIDNELELPLIKASAVDFQITDAGVEATPPEGQDLSQITFTGDCLQRSTALITTARDIAASVSNKLGEDTREDLLRYANHLENSESGNPHYLVSTCVGIRADLDDPFVSDALGHRLTRKLENFLSQHNDFLAHCLPATAEAVQVKADTHPTREVTKEEATAVLNTLEEAIAQAEASTESYSKVIAEFRAFDDHLNDLKIKAFHPGEIERLRNAVQRETVELGAFGARLYWRAKQVVSRARLHAGDIAIAGTISGKTGEQMAAAVVQYLEPLMRKLGELFTALPPL
ncbi:hypothetical protein SAMN04488093_102356 [Tropicibacter naphthalenivorans]|uniref:Uncharacterized protein n=1 Tax=Tropicibacter naphthalenivorans TaxID=441103 RepID=A0A0P1G5L8_9RHOB|nr:hypothetical protein TRN7648_01262 [Tropicibacter naphthalenivorans]SMC61333.1 hypothetical protein SAMN04488093_102356 [Tropicibacter naphthalenivorans]